MTLREWGYLKRHKVGIAGLAVAVTLGIAGLVALAWGAPVPAPKKTNPPPPETFYMSGGGFDHKLTLKGDGAAAAVPLGDGGRWSGTWFWRDRRGHKVPWLVVYMKPDDSDWWHAEKVFWKVPTQWGDMWTTHRVVGPVWLATEEQHKARRNPDKPPGK